MKTYYLVDFENLHEEALKITKKATEKDSLIIFFTSNTPKISLEALENQKAKPEIIKCNSGKQSLDLCLVSYLGYQIKSDGKNSKYVIVSDDSGFDNVISFWKDRKITTVSRQAKATEEAGKKSEISKDKSKNSPSKKAESSKDKNKNSQNKKTELNNSITKILNEALPQTDNKTKGEIVSLAVKNAEAGKQNVYRKMIQKYGQKKGLDYYNAIKKAL